MITSRSDYRFVSVPNEIEINSGIMPLRDVASASGSATPGSRNHWRVLRGEDPALLYETWARLRSLSRGLWYSGGNYNQTPLPDHTLARDVSIRRLANIEALADSATSAFDTTEAPDDPSRPELRDYQGRFIRAVSPASPASSRSVLPMPSATAPIVFPYSHNWMPSDLLWSCGYIIRELGLDPVLRTDLVTPTCIADKYLAQVAYGTPAPLESDDIRAMWHNLTLLRRVIDPYEMRSTCLDFSIARRATGSAVIGGKRLFDWQCHRPSASDPYVAESCRATEADLASAGVWPSFSIGGDATTRQANMEARVASTFDDNPWTVIGLFTVVCGAVGVNYGRQGAIVTLSSGTGIAYGQRLVPNGDVLGNMAEEIARNSSLWRGTTDEHYLSVGCTLHIIVDIDSRLEIPLSAWNWPGTDYKQY